VNAVEDTPARRAALRARMRQAPAPKPEPRRRRLRARALSGATRAAAWIPHPVVRGTLTALTPLAAATRYERQTRSNLELALSADHSADELRRIARGVRAHAARQFAEWLRLAGADDAARAHWLAELVELDESVAILERECARRGGAIVVTAHIGNWELLAARIRQAGHAGAVVGYRRPRDASAQWFERMRARYGVRTIPQSAPPREIVRTLDAGGVVGLLADLEVRRLDGEFLPFLGRDALTMTAPAALARATQRPLLPARCVFDRARGRYVLSFEPALEPDPALDRRARTRDLTLRLNAVFERWIRAHPEQWAWHQPRWRTRPDEAMMEAPARRRPRGTALERPRDGGSLPGIDRALSAD
jgi:KDO2-lipid IV(A) lauroyltransferase